MSASPPQSSIEDHLDRAIMRALQVAPRAPFSELAAVLGVSEQTVARRYGRLRRVGALRVTAVVNAEALGESNWIVRVQCRPSGATSLAQALAQREDVGWVSVSAGGTQVLCTVRSRTAEARDDLLLQRLPRTTQVLGISAALVMHRFLGGGSDDWTGVADALTPEQDERLRAGADGMPGDPEPSTTEPSTIELDEVDIVMLGALIADGRASIAALAAAAGISEGRASRRLQSLLVQHVVYLDVDAPPEALGFRASTSLWLTVVPAHLDQVGRELAGCPEIAFAAAITGTRNIYAASICRDVAALYRFLVERVGAIAGISAMEVTPVQRVVKQSGTLVSDGRLAL